MENRVLPGGAMPLDQVYRQYREGLVGRKTLEGAIFVFVKKYALRYLPPGINRDCAEDFAYWLYPRTVTMIDRYRDKGAGFDAFVAAVLRTTAREYHVRLVEREMTEQACWGAKSSEMMACEEEPPYEASQEQFKPVHNRKQVLTLLLKSYHYLSDDYLKRAAPALRMSVDKLRGMVDEIRNHRLVEEEKVRMFRERVYCQFYRCIAFEKRLIALPHGSLLREKMRDKLARARKRLRSMRRTLAGMKLEASNWQIAHVMGVSKGTVDSNLHTLMSRYKSSQTPP